MGTLDDLLAEHEGAGKKSALDTLIEQQPISQVGAAAIGFTQGASFNLADELSGIQAAGMPSASPGSPSAPERESPGAMLAGLARIGYDYITGKKTGAISEYEQARNAFREQEKAAETQFPGTTLGSSVVGGLVLPLGGAAGKGLSFGQRVIRGGNVGLAAGAAGGFGAGEGPEDTALKTVVGGGLGIPLGAAAVPVFEGLIKGGGALWREIANRARRLSNPEAEASRVVAGAAQQDERLLDPNRIASAADVAAANELGATPTILDIGAERTRRLADSAAITGTEGARPFEEVIEPRFKSQTARFGNWLKTTFNYPNVEKQQEAIDVAEKAANKPAYRASYESGDRPIWTPELERLSGDPNVVSAMRSAERKWKSWQINDGYGAMNPPAKVDVDRGGFLTFTNSKGIPTYPNLQYWDYVARDLSGKAQAAMSSGNKTNAKLYGDAARGIKAELDKQVPEFRTAREGAAGFFKAENALEAGQNFVTEKFGNREAQAAFNKMTPDQRKLFQDGFVDRLIQTVEDTKDQRSLTAKLDSMFNSIEGREKLLMVLGKARADELEAKLRVERILDLPRQAIRGNSWTARRQYDLGLAGGVGNLGLAGAAGIAGLGYAYNDPTGYIAGALMGALSTRGRKIDADFASRVARLLVSDDLTRLEQGARIIAKNERMMDNLRTFSSDIATRIGTAGSEQLHRPTSKMERDALPVGTRYTAPDGSERIR